MIALLIAGALALAASHPAAQDDAVTALEGLYQKAAERAAGSVVSISVERDEEEQPEPEPERAGPRVRFGGLGGAFARRPADAWCTGFVVEADGTILTTHFNVSGKVRAIRVRLADGREMDGRLLGYNGTYDLAAIKVDATDLPTLRKSPLEELQTGNTVLALGRAPDGAGLTVNPGIVSAPSRLAGRCVQVDAKLNFGNVGGPLVDTQGRLVAITCKVDTKYAASQGQNSGVGFALTYDRLREVLPDLKAGRSVAESRRPFLGIEAKPESEVEGVELGDVQPGSAADNGGLKKGDVIVEFAGEKILNFEELRAAIGRKSAGDRVKVRVQRAGEELDFECELGWTHE